MGQTGPLSMLAGFGTMAAAISGFFYPVGWTDRAPAGPFGAYTDYTSPRWLVAAVMAALEHKRATGQGQYIDLSQAESALHLLAPGLLDRSVNGRIWERDGNRDLVFAPQGVYRCSGDDNWVAVACTSDEAWAALAGVIGRADLAGLTRAERHARHDELVAFFAGVDATFHASGSTPRRWRRRWGLSRRQRWSAGIGSGLTTMATGTSSGPSTSSCSSG